MANCCSFELKMVGFKCKNDKEEALEIFKNNYSNGNGYADGTRPYMAIYEICVEEEDDTSFLISGDCKWSVQTSMTKEGYYRNRDEESPYTCLEDICSKYQVEVEGYSNECGIGFEEHYICNKEGNLTIEECDYTEVELCDSYEEYIENTDEEYRKKIGVVTKKAWEDAIAEGNYYIPCGGYGEWIFDYVAVA